MFNGIHAIHFIGIGGSGMSAIAKILLEMGYHVSGSDLHQTETTTRLEQMGAKVYLGHERHYINGANAVVISTAIPANNPELLAARERNLPVFHRADIVAKIMQQKRGIAIAGAHGKTTTTSMIALMLDKSGLDPTVLIGGELNDIGGNAKLGKSDYLVAEADESDGSFLKLTPEIAVVTNIEDDHLDFYETIENIVDHFARFLRNLPPSGLAVLCFDNGYLREIAATLNRPVVSYALEHPADYTAQNIRTDGIKSRFTVVYRGEVLGEMELNIPGRHNIANALAAVAVGRYLELDLGRIHAAITTFQGAKRRFQTKGRVNGIWVVDDYAHHPTEIKTTLLAARQTNPARLIVAFQPHRYTRTKLLRTEFGTAFTPADVVILTDIYAAGEKPIPGITGEVLQQEIEQQEKRKVVYIPDKARIADYLTEIVQPGDLVMTMGAGNIWTVGEQLVRNLRDKASGVFREA